MQNFLHQYWRDIANVAGAWFSLAGLIVSFFAAVYAWRAKKSAKEAADAAHRMSHTRTIHEYLTDCSRMAGDISKYIDLAQREMALHSVRETLRLVVLVASRWDSELSIDTRNHMIAARSQLDSIIAVLLKGPIEALGKIQLSTLRVSVQRVANLLTEELGVVTRMREGVEEHE
jgi:hypothetical protein